MCAPLWGPKFFQFHAGFGKIWQNRMLVPPWGVGAPSSGKSWIRHWKQAVNSNAYLPSFYTEKYDTENGMDLGSATGTESKCSL